MRMESLENGITTPRTVRIPDSTWSRLTAWAEASGVGDSEALRRLLILGLENEPSTIVRPLAAWMRREHLLQSGAYVAAAVTPGDEWWDLDEVLIKLPGSKPVQGRSQRTWHAIPADQLDTIRTLFSGRPSRLLLRWAGENRG